MTEHRVWVTRPSPADLCAAIEAAGFRAVAVPTLEIVAPDEPQALAGRARAELENAPLAVFVSRNAVDWLWRLLSSDAGTRLANATVIAVGPGTAAALKERGIDQVLTPERGADSEALLALPALQDTAVAGKTVVIIRGRGGRELLGETLKQRGARVRYLEVYRRQQCRKSAGRLPVLWREQEPAAIVVSSPAGLEALVAMTAAGDRPKLLATRLLCLGRRLPEQAGALGFRRIVPVPATGGDAAIVETLQAQFSGERDS